MLTSLKVTATALKNNGNVIQKNNTSRSLPAAPVQFARELKDDTLQLQQKEPTVSFRPVQKKENKTGLPDNLKTGIENLSGFSMDDVNVHYNSDKPAKLNALAYARGTDIHVAPSQEKHLLHEAWHVVQQKQGRVKATMQMKGVDINDDKGLEKEADITGLKAMQMPFSRNTDSIDHPVAFGIIQREPGDGKEVVNDLTNAGWWPQGAETNSGKKAITGSELKLLMKGAVESAWKTYVYHATRSANVENILSKGLDPQRGGTGAAAGNETFEDHSRDHVHYTRKFDLARDYKRHFEGETPFGRKVEQPEPAEILQITIPKDTVDEEEVDPDSQVSHNAYRVRSAIPGKFIRSRSPKPIPDVREQDIPLKRGANKKAWAAHVKSGKVENDAFLSNMPSYATKILDKMKKRGLDKQVVLQLIKQGLLSMPVSSILEWVPENYDQLRLFQNDINAVGQPLPSKS